MDNENLIAGLEQSLRQIRQARNHKMRRLREIEGEVNGLRQEIETLDNSAKQIETTMHTILFAARSTREGGSGKQQRLGIDDLNDIGDLEDDYLPPKRTSSNFQSTHSPRSVVSMHRSSKDDVPPINPDVQIKSHRFRDRTITQACTILMRESGRPLHVNEIYNRLLEGGFLFTGNNPTISIAVSLNRNRRFRKVAPGTFDLIIRDATQAAS